MFSNKIIKFKTDKKQSESKKSGCFAFIVDSSGNLVVSYSYDAFGRILFMKDLRKILIYGLHPLLIVVAVINIFTDAIWVSVAISFGLSFILAFACNIYVQVKYNKGNKYKVKINFLNKLEPPLSIILNIISISSAVIGIVLFFTNVYAGGVPEIINDLYYIVNHNTIVRQITEQEFYFYKSTGRVMMVVASIYLNSMAINALSESITKKKNKTTDNLLDIE